MNSFKKANRLLIFTMIFTLIAYSLPITRDVALAYDLTTFTKKNKSEYYIGPGVKHSSYSLENEASIQAVNTLEVDPSNPHIKLLVGSPSKVLSLDTVRNQAKQADYKNHRVIGAFNGDFYKTTSPYAGQPIGLQITNGEIISSPVNTKSVLTISEDGSATILDSVKMTSKVEITGVRGTKTLTGINRGRNIETQINSLFLFTDRFSSTTKTSDNELEILLQPTENRVSPNETLTATVEDFLTTNNSPIPEGKWILAASGTQADWIDENLDIGSEIKFTINYGEEIDNGIHAISGGDLILKNGKQTSIAVNDASGRHPRTMFSTKEGKLYITTFDGRQPGYSNGVTLYEGAKYLSDLGMESVINMDGGGSTTYSIRQPGEQGLSILNRPSDGYERRVANSFLVVSTAPVSELATIIPNVSDSIKVLANSTVPISVKGLDKYYNGVNVNANDLSWSASSAVGKIDNSGLFTAGSQAGKGKITIKSGKATKSINVEVVDSLASITISPKDLVIVPGSKQTFKAKGYDSKGKEIFLTPQALTWKTSGSIGTIDKKGTLSSVSKIKKGKVIVSQGKTKAEAIVYVGKSPTTIETFTSIKDISITSARVKSAKGTRVTKPKPVKVGKYAMALSYDFTGTTGTSAAYVNFNDSNGKIGRPLAYRPMKLEMWVYGDAKKHWLRGVIQDGNGKLVTLDFTAQGKLDWKGWKKVSATIPANTPTPIKVRQVYVVETNNNNKNKGTLYFDHMRAIYTELK
ncbi:phosphodiester glycosidase family protein [Bacillus sp. 31A1R]|uniref:Phosphodiester glycosidase family protein n=1 Tax=Robertmurraya mangrovi TaxID=3098077 RepID=A0ABU5J2D3_9BACI|nr:phosphodiester glycosidase family protein [Bacillus sp. 31A1R]MDZ5473569.1 phosphodiester glycosidase family protein [Bacillus sp. 31A1R]